MGRFHPTNVYEESRFFFGVIKLLGLYPIKFYKIRYLNYLYVVILLTFYYALHACVNRYAVSILELVSSINSIVKIRKIRYYTNVILLPVIMISSIYYSTKMKTIHEQIDSVDKSVKYLNMEIDHALCMKNDIIQITTIMFVVILFNLLDYYGFIINAGNYIYVIMWILDRIPDFINTIVICSFAVLINKIKFRFEQINSILNAITNGKSSVSISESSDVDTVCRVKLVKLLKLNLCKTVSLVNEVYIFQFKILSMLYITYICLHINVIYIYCDSKIYAVDVILSVSWGVLDIIKLVYIIHLYRILTIQYT
ncbi:gustatory receptor for bitter taste 66a-like [Colletes gigas]|uniref:gustatory receptor for bitter taste 66a-like n=1 Tax=Colletes gigas TaxID=935657 RepID=UPI001C9A6C1E|nr:gustatory receptor for bitter taste 66a-like [Colletes gigas]